MKKVLVAEIGHSTLILTAFGDLDTDSPLLLGQEVTNLGFEKGLSLLEKDIGVPDTEYLECYIVSSIEQEGLQQVIKTLDHTGKANKIVKTHEAIINISSLFLEEVGDVLILDGDRGSINLYLIQKNQSPLLGEHFEPNQDLRTWVSSTPKTAKEIAARREHTAQALQEAVLHFCSQGSPDSLDSHSSRDLTKLRWVIGTGSALTTLPGGLEMIRESLAHCSQVTFPEAGFPILIDRDNILTSLGALSDTYRQGVWQLLLESLGVES